jgi:hypothetical protein
MADVAARTSVGLAYLLDCHEAGELPNFSHLSFCKGGPWVSFASGQASFLCSVPRVVARRTFKQTPFVNTRWPVASVEYMPPGRTTVIDLEGNPMGGRSSVFPCFLDGQLAVAVVVDSACPHEVARSVSFGVLPEELDDRLRKHRGLLPRPDVGGGRDPLSPSAILA